MVFTQDGPIKKLKLIYRGCPIFQIKFDCNTDREGIKQFVQKMSNSYKTKGKKGWILCSMRFPFGWRSGYLTAFGDPVRLFSLDIYDGFDSRIDPKLFKKIVIYLVYKNGPAGGLDDKHNDCLYYCLKRACIHDLSFKTPALFKKWLGLNRDDLVGIEHMSKIEQHLRYYKINVCGDYDYQSTKDAKLEIHLLLIKEHYTLNTSHIQKLHGVAHQEKKIMIYRKENDQYITYNGIVEKIYNAEEFEEIRSKPLTSEYLCVEYKKYKLTLQQYYNNFINEANMIKEESKGLINCFKTGSPTNTALKLFYYFTQSVNPQEIFDDEARWIKNASQCAVMYAEPYQGDGYKYDFVSMYPSTLSRQKNMYPIKRGQFKKITNDEFINKPLKFGLYRCVIEKVEGSNKYYRFNDSDTYAVKDIITARNYNLTVTLIEDDQPNFLFYSDDCCLTGSQLFGEYVKLLFPIKQNGNKLAKEILNCLWGVLSQNNYKHHKIDHMTLEDYNIDGDNVLDELCPTNDEITATKITYHSQNALYCNRYARICPFVLSNGRYLLATTIKPYIDSIVHCHTDGFISTVPLDLTIGSNLGDIKFEGHDESCNVECINKVKFD